MTSLFNTRRPGKKGQISIILILLAVMVIGLLIFVYVEDTRRLGSLTGDENQLSNLNQQFVRIDESVASCLDHVAWQGLERIGRFGGYTDPQVRISNERGVAYWNYDMVNIQPTLDDVQLYMQQYISDNIDTCIDWDSLQSEFTIKRDEPDISVNIGPENVMVNMSYHFTLNKGWYERSNMPYALTYDLRLRRIFEMATQINARTFDTEFKKASPLQFVLPFGLNVTYNYVHAGQRSASGQDLTELVYMIRDPLQFVDGRNDYTFVFASRFHDVGIPRIVDLPNASSMFKTQKLTNIYSIDKNALVPLPPDIYVFGPPSFDLHIDDPDALIAQSPRAIRVTAHHLETAVRDNVPIKKNKKDTQYGTIVYNLDYPVYGYEPSGTRFSEATTWVYFWPEDQRPQGKVAVLHNDGTGWEPVVSDTNQELGYVITDIDGFSNYTMIDCQSQSHQTVSASDSMKKPPTTCIIIAVTIILIVVLWYVAPVVAKAGTAATTATEAGAGGAAAGTTGGVAGTTATATGTASATAGSSVSGASAGAVAGGGVGQSAATAGGLSAQAASSTAGSSALASGSGAGVGAQAGVSGISTTAVGGATTTSSTSLMTASGFTSAFPGAVSPGFFGTSYGAFASTGTLTGVSATAYTGTAIGGYAMIGTGAVGSAGAIMTSRAVNIDPLTGESLPMVFPRIQRTGIMGITGHATDIPEVQELPLPSENPDSRSQSTPQNIPFGRSVMQTQQFMSNANMITPYDSSQGGQANYTMGNESDNQPREKKQKQEEQTAQDQQGCITFKPACDGTITVKKDSDKAKGKCSMKTGTQVKGGQTYQICAQISECTCFCGCTCTLSCEVTYT